MKTIHGINLNNFINNKTENFDFFFLRKFRFFLRKIPFCLQILIFELFQKNSDVNLSNFQLEQIIIFGF